MNANMSGLEPENSTVLMENQHHRAPAPQCEPSQALVLHNLRREGQPCQRYGCRLRGQLPGRQHATAGFKLWRERNSGTFLINALAKKNVSEVDVAGFNSDANLTFAGLWHINIVTQMK